MGGGGWGVYQYVVAHNDIIMINYLRKNTKSSKNILNLLDFYETLIINL
jgi:hypothetical protein